MSAPIRPFTSRIASLDHIDATGIDADTPFVGELWAAFDADHNLIGLIDECPSVVWCEGIGADELLDALEEDAS